MNTPVTMLAAVLPSPKEEKRGKRQQLAPASVTQGDNYFDLLPDDLLCQILNRVLDAKSLCQCLLLSKRFASLVPEVHALSLLATAPNLSSFYSAKKPPSSTKWKTNKFLKKLLHHLVIRPLEFFHPIATIPTTTDKNTIGPAQITNWISNSLNNFGRIHSLRLELPPGGGVVGFPDDVPLLRWTAQFGKELESCAIIAATSFNHRPAGEGDQTQELAAAEHQPSPSHHHHHHPEEEEEEETTHLKQDDQDNTNNNSCHDQLQQQPLLSDADLKTRVVWILSCLIAAGARHGLLRQILLDCPNLRAAHILDSSNQGKLSMNEDQINALRQSLSASPPNPIWKRSAIPNLIMKLWYVPELQLKASGRLMKGATVIIVKPEGLDDTNEELIPTFSQHKDEGIDEAAREIMKSKWRLMYKMQMNSF